MKRTLSFNSEFFIKQIIPVIFLIFLNSGCKKDELSTTIIEGRFLTARIDEIVPEGPYKILLISENRSGPVDSTYTNENGLFRFEYSEPASLAIDEYFYLVAKGNFPEGYADFEPGSNSMNIHKIPPGFNGNVDIYLFLRGWIEIHVVNIDPMPYDEIWVQYQNYGHRVFHGFADEKFYYRGPALHVPTTVSYSIGKNGGPLIRKDSVVFLPKMDTLYFKIEY